MATQREICLRILGSMPSVAPKKMKAPEKGLTIENSAPKASRKVAKCASAGCVCVKAMCRRDGAGRRSRQASPRCAASVEPLGLAGERPASGDLQGADRLQSLLALLLVVFAIGPECAD